MISLRDLLDGSLNFSFDCPPEKRFESLVAAGEACEAQGDYSTAVSVYQRAILWNPDIYSDRSQVLDNSFHPPDTPLFRDSPVAKVYWVNYLCSSPSNSYTHLRHLISYLHAEPYVGKFPELSPDSGIMVPHAFDALFSWIQASESQLGHNTTSSLFKNWAGYSQTREQLVLGLFQLSFPCLPKDLAGKHLEHVQQLKVGESYLIAGMVQEQRGAHALCYEIVKQQDGQYAFVVINTGAGIECHDRAVVGNKLKYCPYYQIVDIPADVLCQFHFFKYLMDLYCLRCSLEKVSDFYPKILELLHKLSTTKSEPVSSDSTMFITSQRSGSCALSVWKAVMRRHLSVSDYKKLMFLIKCKSMIAFYEVLSSSFPNDQKGWTLLKICVAEYLKRLQKIASIAKPEDLLSEEDKEKIQKILYATRSCPNIGTKRKREEEDESDFPLRKKRKLTTFSPKKREKFCSFFKRERAVRRLPSSSTPLIKIWEESVRWHFDSFSSGKEK